jgi:DNA repair protein RadC
VGFRKQKTRLCGPRLAKIDLEPYGLGAANESCAPPLSPSRMIHVCVKRPSRLGPKVEGPETVCSYLRTVANQDRESFYALHLDAKMRVIGVEEVGRGTVASVDIRPADIFKSALLTNAHSLIVAHNHPSGSSDPSEADFAMTRAIVNAGKLLGIPIRDHVVVGSEGCHSMREKGNAGGFSGSSASRRRRFR